MTTEKETKKGEKPVKKGEKLKVTIDYRGDKGDGILRKNDFVIIVKEAAQNKTYEIEITAVYATYAFARIIKEIKQEKKETEEQEEI